MLELYVSAFIYGLSISAILLLVSIGISIGFGLMRIINMEQMVYYTFGAYMTYALVSVTGSFWLGLLAGTVVAAVSGAPRAGTANARLTIKTSRKVVLLRNIRYLL